MRVTAGSSRVLHGAMPRPLYTGLLIAAAAFAASIFDRLVLPLGIASGVAYVLPVVLAIWLPSRYLPLAVAAGCTVLTLLGYVASAPPPDVAAQWTVAVNRGLAIFAIWTAAALGYWWRTYADRLEQERIILRTVIDTSGDAVVTIDERGTMLSFSRAGEQLFGYSEAEVLGRNVSMLMPSPDRERHDGYLARYLETGERRILGTGRHVMALRKDGTIFPAHLTVDEVRTETGRLFTAFIHDTTERVEAERALAEERDFLSTILDTTDALLVVTDGQDRILRFNRACQKLTGRDLKEVRGTQRSLLETEELRGQWLAAMERLRRGASRVRCESVWMNPRGERHEIVWTSTAVHGTPGEVRYFVGAGIDVTEVRAAQTKVERLQSDLYRIGRLGELGEMASAIAHELNQPLTAVANYVGASRRVLAEIDAEPVQKVAGLMDRAVEQTDRAGQIIRRLRQLIGRGQSELRSADINAVVRDACALAFIGAEEKGVSTRVELAKELPAVLADATQIQQVVFNLVRNSLDAMEARERREVVVRTRMAGEHEVEVTVSDSGPGLTPEVSAQLFMPFVTTKRTGMGIGLSICRSIIEAHQGRIWATPNDEIGVTFGFALPADASVSEAEHG